MTASTLVMLVLLLLLLLLLLLPPHALYIYIGFCSSRR
jgi:hypothetical protein